MHMHLCEEYGDYDASATLCGLRPAYDNDLFTYDSYHISHTYLYTYVDCEACLLLAFSRRAEKE